MKRSRSRAAEAGSAVVEENPDPQPILAGDDPAETASPEDFAVPVVAIGASAGGLDAFKRLLGKLPPDTGFAIVFLQHLDPNHASMLVEILARGCAMPVSVATDGLPVEPNRVYVLPPNADLEIASGALKLTPRTPPPALHLPIDRFLRSLAEELGSRSIGVILSGAGSDGSLGIQAIKAAGGMTFAQDTTSSKFAAMPQSAVATGCVDFVLPVEEIAAELIRMSHHPYLGPDSGAAQERLQLVDKELFAGILAQLHGATGVDFSFYRERTVTRRILRRLALNKIESLAKYSERLRDDPMELLALQRDLLISVTRFFRDPETFEVLKSTVFTRILERRADNEPVRIWVAGCATGEEAYSIGIVLQEFLNEHYLACPVQIFGSDLSAAAIEKARVGRYPEAIAMDVPEERLSRYFTKVEGGYQISRALREMCVFTRHNLIDDPPFSKLDLISCRNVLIYLGSVQKDILRLFHYALKPNAFLLLGASEASGRDPMFAVVDRVHRVYAKREIARKHYQFPVRGLRRQSAPAASWTGPAPRRREVAETRKEVDQILLTKYGLSGLVVDEDSEVLEILGSASPYLALPSGKTSFHLAKLIPDAGLFLEVENLIQRVRTTGESARQEHVLSVLDGSEVHIEAIALDASQQRTVLVVFEPVPSSPPGTPRQPLIPEGTPELRQIARLKQQLADSRERLIEALEETQSSMEESQSTTEEALSANEELQSLNEELETAKEELQSTNEELISVNDELQNKNTALAQARDFAISIVEAIRHPLMVLDGDLHVRMANRAFYHCFQLTPGEAEGHSVFTLSKSAWDMPALRYALDGMVREGASIPEFEVEQEFPGAGRKNLVIGGCRIPQVRMILLAVDDVTEAKRAQQSQREAEERLRQNQKMESLGRLAGGISHDFNNLLTIILGYTEMLTETVTEDATARFQLLEIQSAAEKAASVTRQLLSFSRRQVLNPQSLDLNSIVEDCDRLLRRSVGPHIHVALKMESKLWRVKADAGEISRALINLCLNARDAMPNGGNLTLETANLTVSDTGAAHQSLAAGRYVMIAVHDSGIGIDLETRAHIFEPFFTTKEVGKGTGLGLSSVLGIVEQSGGSIRCESEPGRGTTFSIFLPANADVETGKSETVEARPRAAKAKNTEAILVVEDHDMVRSMTRTVLDSAGYQVFEAASGLEGLDFCQKYSGSIDLLITDVMMPGIGGREFAENALQLRPDLKVLFVSGHTEDVVLKEGIQEGTPFLQKPYKRATLLQRVREILDFQGQFTS